MALPGKASTSLPGSNGAGRHSLTCESLKRNRFTSTGRTRQRVIVESWECLRWAQGWGVGHSMTKKITMIFTLMLALVVSGCAVSSTSSTSTPSITSTTTPNGYPCTSVSDVGCFYFISNGTAVACDVIDNSVQLDYCDNANTEFYDYSSGGTVLCADRECETTTAMNTPSLSATAPPLAAAIPAHCSAKFAYDHLSDGGQAWEVVNKLEDQNTTEANITTTFTSSSAITVSTSVSASAGINISASASVLFATIFASVHAQINASVAKSATTVVGNEVRVSIPPGKTVYGIYGVSVQVADGHLYQSNKCNGQANYGAVQSYVPIAPGWCVWISGQTSCRIVSGD